MNEEQNQLQELQERTNQELRKYIDAINPELQALIVSLNGMRASVEKQPELAARPVGDEALKFLIMKALTEAAEIAAEYPDSFQPPQQGLEEKMFECIRYAEKDIGEPVPFLEMFPSKPGAGRVVEGGGILDAYIMASFARSREELQQPILKAADTAALTKQIPVGVGPEVILDALRLGAKGLKAIGPIESRVTSSRKREVKGPSKIEEKSRPNMRTLIHQNAGYVSSTTIPDIEKLSRGSKDLKKWFMFVMMKANEATDAEGNIIRSRIEFPYKEVVELGMYSRADNAKRGFEKFAASANSGLFNVSITVTDRKGAIAAEAGGHLFGTEIYRGFGVIVLNREQQYLWPLVMDKYGMLPSFYFALDDKAADLLHYVSYLARQNMDKIKSQGYFNIGFRAIQERLCLPAEAGQRNQKRDTIGAIESAVKKIEEQQKDKGTELFRFLLIYNEDESITQQLDNGRLQVEVCGEIKERYSQLQKKKQKKIDTSIKKREQGKAARQKQLQTAESDQE